MHVLSYDTTADFGDRYGRLAGFDPLKCLKRCCAEAFECFKKLSYDHRPNAELKYYYKVQTAFGFVKCWGS